MSEIRISGFFLLVRLALSGVAIDRMSHQERGLQTCLGTVELSPGQNPSHVPGGTLRLSFAASLRVRGNQKPP